MNLTLSPCFLRYSAFSMSVSAQYYLRKRSKTGDRAPLSGHGLHQRQARQVSQSLHHRPVRQIMQIEGHMLSDSA